MEESAHLSPHVAPQAAGLLSARTALSLALLALTYAAVIGWTLLGTDSALPLAGILPPSLLPATLCVVSCVLGALSAPVLLTENSSRLRGLFAAFWQTAALAFFLLLSARVTPLASDRILGAAVWSGLCTFIAIQLHRIAPRAAPGLVFFWLFALPVCAYLFAEVFLTTPAGGNGWARASGPAAENARAVVHWMLALSPITGAAGALSGTLPDGGTCAGTVPLAVLSGVNAVLLLRPAAPRSRPT